VRPFDADQRDVEAVLPQPGFESPHVARPDDPGSSWGSAMRFGKSGRLVADQMIAAAQSLGSGFEFVRVDFYEVAGRALLGEMTFFLGSGLEPVEPLALDAAMGGVVFAGSRC
jgi:TupA-like ATPgrasp